MEMKIVQQVVNELSRLEHEIIDPVDVCANLADILEPFMDIHRAMLEDDDPEVKASRRLSQIMESNT